MTDLRGTITAIRAVPGLVATRLAIRPAAYRALAGSEQAPSLTPQPAAV